MDNLQKDIEDFKKELELESWTPQGWVIWSGDKLKKSDLPKSEFLIDGFIPEAGITCLASNPSQGKSWLMLEIAKCVSSGRPLFDKYVCKEKKVLYLDEESTLGEIKRRWEMLDPAFMTITDFMSLQGFKLDRDEDRADLLTLAKARGYGLIIFDSLRDLHNLRENDSGDTQRLIDFFREYTRAGITILISHHLRKENYLASSELSQLVRGSTAFFGGLDSLLTIKLTRKTSNLMEMLVSQPKLRQGKPNSPFKITLTEIEQKMTFSFKGEVEEEDSKLENCKGIILTILEDGEKNPKALAEALIPMYFSERLIEKAIKELRDNKEIKPRKEGKYVFYSLTTA